MLEKIKSTRLNDVLYNDCVIPEHQFGFRRNHAIVTQFHRVCEHVHVFIRRYKIFVAFEFYIRFVKRLLYTQKHSWVVLLCMHWKQRSTTHECSMNTLKSPILCQNKGREIKVQWGSSWGSARFHIRIDSLPHTHQMLSYTFADHSVVLSSDLSHGVVSKKLQVRLDKVHTWMKSWRTKAIVAKSKHITFTLRKEECPWRRLGLLGNSNNTVVKHLGFYLNRRQTWKTHI